MISAARPLALTADAESAVGDSGGHSTRLAAPERRWPVIDAATEARRPWYHHLTDEFLAAAEHLTAMSALEAAHDTAIAAVCRTASASVCRYGVHLLLPPDFVVLILERGRDDEPGLLRASADTDVLDMVRP
ncbi:hypothetical protein [Catenuloplanes japonicus]|uniref:hypothetical protein n=1 Tax=Catenuloplanes japonicus TaxID=33876 RepID=UPI000525CED1|nr:hypothetical protein [Catenuloplanes japonicus]